MTMGARAHINTASLRPRAWQSNRMASGLSSASHRRKARSPDKTNCATLKSCCTAFSSQRASSSIHNRSMIGNTRTLSCTSHLITLPATGSSSRFHCDRLNHRVLYFPARLWSRLARGGGDECAGCKNPRIHFEIFTLVPRWFFAESLTASFTYHQLLTDIGLAQESSLKEDVPQTLKRLRGFLPFDSALISALAQRIAKCDLVVCDIAPLGIAVARQAGVPAVLIENFTWDWIYAGYHDARFTPHIDYLRGVFRSADYHIQTEPVCARWRADLTTPPVSRAPRMSRKRNAQAIGDSAAKQNRADYDGRNSRATFVSASAGGTQTYSVYHSRRSQNRAPARQSDLASASFRVLSS